VTNGIVDERMSRERRNDDPTWLWEQFRTWGLRAFACMLLALALLAGAYALRHNQDWRIVFKVACGSWSYLYAWRARLARRRSRW
jgi:hypothetical protein